MSNGSVVPDQTAPNIEQADQGLCFSADEKLIFR